MARDARLRPSGLLVRLLALAAVCALPAGADRAAIWVDLYEGEPVTFDAMADDLASVDIVYLGETHSIRRHHRLQEQIIAALADRGRDLVIGMEQLQAHQQPAVDRSNSGEIGPPELAREVDWAHSWSNYRDYFGILRLASERKARVVALNARPELIRNVGRQGLDGLTPEERSELPDDIVLDDPVYERLMGLLLQVHATMPKDHLRTIFEAQVARDETMAAAMASAMEHEPGKLGIVVAGAGHVRYGLGMPVRVSRRLPDSRHRIVLFSDSGDLVLSKEEAAMAREVEITHDDLRFVPAPLADYVSVKELP